jgi:Sec-independent protein translocase protein TatA
MPCQICGIRINRAGIYYSMDEKVTLVIGLTVLIVVSVNVILFFGFRDRSLPYQIELFRRAAQRARDPWQDEDDALEELSNLVSKLENRENLIDQDISTQAKKADE